MADIRPRNGYALVKLVVEEEKLGTLFLPPGVGPIPTRGIVVVVDESYIRTNGAEMDLQPGDEVMFFKGRGVDVRLGEEDLLLIHEKEILAVTEPVPSWDKA